MFAPPLCALGFLQVKGPLVRGGSLSISPPQIIFLEQPHDWIPTVINAIQFLLLVALTYYIFRKNYRQKHMERQAEWYHRLVTDFAIEKITDFSQDASSILSDLAKEVARLKAISAPRAAMDMTIQGGLGKFKQSLYAITPLVAGRLLVFEKKLEQSLVDCCNDLEDKIAEWFATEASAAAGEPRPGLFQLVNDWQSDALKLIRDYEFEKWS
jgi:hypothetical protein